MFVMPVALRTDFDAVACRLAAKRSKDGPQARRLLTLAAIYEGASRSEAARIGGVTVQIVRDWVVKFNSRGSEGLIDRKGPRPTAAIECRAPGGDGGDDRERTHARHPWRRTMASCRSGAMAA